MKKTRGTTSFVGKTVCKTLSTISTTPGRFGRFLEIELQLLPMSVDDVIMLLSMACSRSRWPYLLLAFGASCSSELALWDAYGSTVNQRNHARSIQTPQGECTRWSYAWEILQLHCCQSFRRTLRHPC